MDINLEMVSPEEICKLKAENWFLNVTNVCLLGYSIGATAVIELQKYKIKKLTTKASKIMNETE